MFRSTEERLRGLEAQLHARATLAIRPDEVRERPLTTASLSAATGFRPETIANLFDISLSPLGRVEPTSQHSSEIASALTSLRRFRRTFNRIDIAKDGEMATADVAKALLELEKGLEAIITHRLHAEKVSVAFRHAAAALLTENRFVPLEKAREIAAYVMGTAANAALESLDAARESRLSEPLTPEHLRPLASQDTLEKFDVLISRHRAESRAAHVAMRTSIETTTKQPDADSTPSIERITPCAGDGALMLRSAPIHFVAASRRAFLGVKLAAAHGLKDKIDGFKHEPSISNLLAVRDTMRAWRAGEGVVALINQESQRPEQQTGTTEALGRHVHSAPGASRQSVLRDVASGVVEWASKRYRTMPEGTRAETLAHVSELLSGLSRALQSLTAREMLETLSVMSFPKETQLTGTNCKWDVKSPFPFSRWLETTALGRVFGTHEGDPFDDCTGISNLPDRKIGKILSLLKTSPLSQGTLSHVAPTSGELAGLRTLTRWINALADRFEKNLPVLPSKEAMWVSEFDGGDGVTLPRDIERHFEEMQREHIVSQGSKESGFVEPESTTWLRSAIDKHDGFLLTINEGDPRTPLNDSEPEALLVVTCDQKDPSPIMLDLRVAAQPFLSRLPQTRTGTAPTVLAELAVVTSEGSALRREYGEAPLETLVRQAEFNIISRFAEHERIDCLAICRKGSVALKAHKRHGYAETGATYTDNNGTVFDIIYKAVYPADVILGYRDLNR
jgi:hypothetical protein